MTNKPKRWTDNTFSCSLENKQNITKPSKHFNPPSLQIERLKEQGRWKHSD